MVYTNQTGKNSNDYLNIYRCCESSHLVLLHIQISLFLVVWETKHWCCAYFLNSAL